MNILNEVDKPIVKKTVVIYAGRFQPFHKGHYAAYSKLVSKFGRNNVYIGTSDDTSGPKSPFNFNEKKHIATTMFGIPANRFIQIKNPYRPVEILKGFDGQTTQYIAAVGEKDATRLQGKYFKPYNGKAGYGYDEIGYVYPVPAEKEPISGTDVRNYLGGDDMEKAKGFFLKAYPKFNQDIFDMITDKIKSKQMQSLEEYGARSMGTGMSGDFGPSPVSKMDDEDELTEDGLPGGAFTGLVSSAGYINGAPKPKDVNKLSKKIHKGDDKDTHPKYVYDPIAEILYNVGVEELFKEFVDEYFGNNISEKGGRPNKGKPNKNPIMDKDIEYTRASGKKDKIKVKDALRLKKDHPAHIAAEKMLGDEKPKTKSDKKDTESGEEKKGEKSKEGGDDKKGKEGTEPKKEEPIKLPPTELKSDAEKTPEEKNKEELLQNLQKEKESLSKEDQDAADTMNNPESAERKSMGDKILGGIKKFGRGIKDWAIKKKDVIGDSMGAVRDLATRGGLGAVQDKDGKYRHWDEFTQVGRGGEPAFEYVENDELDKNGKPTGNKIGEHRPKLREDLNDEEKELFEKSWERRNHQVHQMKHFAKDTMLILGSMAAGGALVGGISAIAGGASTVGGIAGAAYSGATGVFTHGVVGFGAHLGKDIVKHATLETMGLTPETAAAAGAGLSAATGGILEGVDDNETNDVSTSKFLNNFITRTVEKIKNYKLSDEQMLASIKSYKKSAKKREKQSQINAAANLLKESVSKSKVRNIADFVGYSVKRLKLKNKPNIKLILGQQYSEQNGSLGGYSPETKDIYVVVPKRMTADICRTIAHELIHRKQDEMGLIRNSNTQGKTGSPIENQANALAGILLRDYGKINKEIYTEGIIVENLSDNATSDQPNGAFLPKGHKRIVGADDGVNKSDYWFHNGGYIQLEYPEADGILGDDDANQIYIRYVTKNVPRQSGPKTNFTTNSDKAKIISEMGKGDIHFKAVFDHYRKGNARVKQMVAMLVTGNKYAKSKEIVKGLMEMDKEEIEEIETRLKISPFESISENLQKITSEISKSNIHFKNIYKHWRDGDAKTKQSTSAIVTGNKFSNQKEFVRELTKLTKREIIQIENVLGIKNEIYGGDTSGWYGSGMKRWVDDNENDYTDTSKSEDINIDVNPGDEVLMGKFKNKKVKIKDIGKDQHGMPTINGKQATTFRTIKEANYADTGFSEDGSFRSPYHKSWENWDKKSQSNADIIGYKIIGHTSDSYKEKKKGVVLPSGNPTEENGPAKRVIHPSKGEQYAKDKKEKWEMYPFNSRPQAYEPPPDIGTQIDVFKYTKPKVIKENIEEWNQLLLEGGAYGHMSHPFDDMDLTFGDLKDIITKALDGELGVVREKTDGQALAISWKGGRLIAARNKSHLQNAGANAMGIEDVASKFAGRGGLTDAYNYAMKDLSVAISGLSKGQRDKIFNEGKCFMNIEVIWPTSVNVIPYGQALLVFHNTTCYDESGKAIAADQSAARTLAGMIKQVNADVQSKYTIQGPPITSIPKNQNLSSKKSQYLSKLSKLQNEFGLSESDTVALYHQSWWENFIDKKAPIKVDNITKEALVKRWAFGDKSFRLNTISNEELVKWAIDTDKVNVAKQQKENIKPFEEIFLGVGADILEFVSSVLTVYPDKAVRNMKDRLKSIANQVRKAGNPTQIQKLKTELERLNKLGGIDKIVAVEGLVFFYNGKTYKLTGTFAPLNQILGIFYG